MDIFQPVIVKAPAPLPLTEEYTGYNFFFFTQLLPSRRGFHVGITTAYICLSFSQYPTQAFVGACTLGGRLSRTGRENGTTLLIYFLPFIPKFKLVSKVLRTFFFSTHILRNTYIFIYLFILYTLAVWHHKYKIT